MLDIALAEEPLSSSVSPKSFLFQFLVDPERFAMRGEDVRYRQFSFLAAFLLYNKDPHEQEAYLKLIHGEWNRMDLASIYFMKKDFMRFARHYWEYQTTLKHRQIAVDPRMVDYLLDNLAAGRDEYLMKSFGYSFVAVKILGEMADTLCLM